MFILSLELPLTPLKVVEETPDMKSEEEIVHIVHIDTLSKGILQDANPVRDTVRTRVQYQYCTQWPEE